MYAMILFGALFNGLLSLSGAFAMLFGHKKDPHSFMKWLLPLTAGVLLATALIDILPEPFTYIYTREYIWVLIGILLSYFGSRTHNHVQAEGKPSGVLIIGTILHNILFGAIIGVFGITTGSVIGVAAVLGISDIGHEVSVASLLIVQLKDQTKVVKLLLLLTIPTFVGAVIGIVLRNRIYSVLPYILSLLAGWFIYLAVHDTFGLMEEPEYRTSVWKQLLWIILGIIFVIGVLRIFAATPFGVRDFYIDHPM